MGVYGLHGCISCILHPQIGMKSYESDHVQKENHIKSLIDVGYGCYMYLLNNAVLKGVNVNNASFH